MLQTKNQYLTYKIMKKNLKMKQVDHKQEKV